MVRFADPMPVQENTEIKSPKLDNSNNKTKTQWINYLAYPPHNVMEMTLKATTQMATAPLEMERRGIPRKAYQPRAVQLHPKRIPGRCYSDTFFSTVTSIRKFLCVQLFVYSLSDYIYIKHMRQERQSHSALQDCIRDVGAPGEMFTDNSLTQTGTKWTNTLQSLYIKWRGSAPHKQNQNKAERKIQDVKNRTVKTLYHTQAPLVVLLHTVRG